LPFSPFPSLLSLLSYDSSHLSGNAFFFGESGLDFTTLYLKDMLLLPLVFGLGGAPPRNKLPVSVKRDLPPSVKLPKGEIPMFPSIGSIVIEFIALLLSEASTKEAVFGLAGVPVGVLVGVVPMSLFILSFDLLVDFTSPLPLLDRLLDALPIHTGSTKSSPFE
jgi:hypothetical protein